MGALFLFVGFLYFIQSKVADSQYEAVSVAVKEIALTVQDEISLARGSADGYSRTFVLPSNLNGLTYQAEITENSIFVRTLDGRHAIVLPVGNVTGDVILGNNLVYKIDGEVFLN